MQYLRKAMPESFSQQTLAKRSFVCCMFHLFLHRRLPKLSPISMLTRVKKVYRIMSGNLVVSGKINKYKRTLEKLKMSFPHVARLVPFSCHC